MTVSNLPPSTQAPAGRDAPAMSAGAKDDAEKLGVQLASAILERGGREILREVYEAEGQ